ncbi:EAL domain-containing protein [Sphingomonas koreensis]|nr:EAL domain-containing protein [Sphingomonas koreensis]
MARQTASLTLSGISLTPSDTPEAANDRRAAIREYCILDTVPEPNFDDIAKLAATIFETAAAAISFIDDDRQWFKSVVGLGMHETPISHSFCAHTILQDDVMVVEDATSDPRFVDNMLVTGEPHLRFYAGMPIRAADGTAVAALCVIDPVARLHGITDVQRTTLKVLAAQVETQLELRRAIIRRDEHADEQRRLSSAFRFLAEHDTLTGLPNRSVFNERLLAATQARGHRSRAAVMLIDVDHFKQVNDAFGHDAGDALLREFGARLTRNLRAHDTIARLGGDEFGSILHGMDGDEALESICRSLDNRLREPLAHEGRLIECRASIGIAIYPDHAATPEGLVKCADLALSAAKARRGSIVMFQENLCAEFEREVGLLAEARSALTNGAVVPGYQPKIDLRTGLVAGFEALVRLSANPGLREHPQMFACAFGDRELAVEIGARMTQQVLDDVKSWSNAGVAFGHVAINSCAADFVSNDYAERLLAMLANRNLDPRLIELEVTEGVFLGRGSHHVERALAKLSSAGIRIALDDFGTGYASLSHLRKFPVDILKIDRTFVAGACVNADDAAIVRALVGLGQSLGIETIAEGVETPGQAALVKAAGCSTAQGYLYGAACAARLVPAVIAKLACARAA